MLKRMLEENIQVVKEIGSWEEAINYASKPLLEKNLIETKYVEAMIQNIRELGPYVVLMPGVAMPHSRPEHGVNETSMSLLKIDTGISFSEKKEDVKLVFILAAKDSTSHMDAIVGLTDLLECEDRVRMLTEAKNSNEIYSII